MNAFPDHLRKRILGGETLTRSMSFETFAAFAMDPMPVSEAEPILAEASRALGTGAAHLLAEYLAREVAIGLKHVLETPDAELVRGALPWFETDIPDDKKQVMAHWIAMIAYRTSHWCDA